MHCNEIKYAVVFDSVRLYTYKTSNPERPARDCELHYSTIMYNPSPITKGFAYEFLPTVNYIYIYWKLWGPRYSYADVHPTYCKCLIGDRISIEITVLWFFWAQNWPGKFLGNPHQNPSKANPHPKRAGSGSRTPMAAKLDQWMLRRIEAEPWRVGAVWLLGEVRGKWGFKVFKS